MTERELEQRLRDWFQAEIADGREAPAGLRTSVAGIPDTMPTPVTVFGGRRNLALLAVAAMLAALLIGGALAVGSGLIRLPWMDDDRADGTFPLAGPTAQCDRTLAEGVLLTAVPLGTAEWPDATQLTAYEDGLVVIGFPPNWGGAPPTVGLNGTWSQRRLTAEGISDLMGAVTGSLPSCQSFDFDEHMEIRARAEGDVFSIGIGLSVLETRQTTPAQAAVVADLVDRLRDPDLGLAASGWSDAEWHSYLPQRWRILVEFTGPSYLGYPSSEGLVLPDGSTLQTFGVEEPDAANSAFAMVRCGTTDTDGARAMAAVLTDAAGSPDESPVDVAWRFSVGTEVFPETAAVSLVGLLPHEPDCPSGIPPAGAQPAEPPQSPSTDRSAPFTDACDYVPASLVVELFGSIDGPSEHYAEWNDDWAFCWYPVEGDGLVIFSSRRPFPGDRAVDQATSLFGGNFSTEQIAGRDVFFGGCSPSVGQCRAAVAISTEPHFVVITWNSQATLRQLAERLIQELSSAE